MERKSWFCSLCRSAQASHLCLCHNVETFLCAHCIAVHFSSFPERVHNSIPMAFYGNHLIPGYFERLAMRNATFAKRHAVLISNIATVSECARGLEDKIQDMIMLLSDYRSRMISCLRTVRANLESEINTAVQEFEQGLYYEDSKITNGLTRKLRSVEATDSDFLLFSYEIEGKEFPVALESIVKYSTGPQAHVQKVEYLAAIDGKYFSLYSPEGSKIQSLLLPEWFHKGTMIVVTLLSVFFLGGTSNKVFSLSRSTEELIQKSAMITPRYYFGCIQIDGVIYAFGGHSFYGMAECEKYDIAADGWKALPKMGNPRSCFTPCAYLYEIYLPCLRTGNRVLEKFDIVSQTFSTVRIQLPEAQNSCISFILSGELIILDLKEKKRYRWRIESEDPTFRMSVFTLALNALSESSNVPITAGNKAVWIDALSSEPRIYSLDLNSVTRP